MRRRDDDDYGGDPYAELGADVRGTGGSSRLTAPLRQHRGHRRGRWVDRRPLKRPRWLRNPVDRDTVITWARNARDQAERARAFAREYRAALERKEQGHPASIVLLRAQSLSDQDLRTRVARNRCAALCGELRDGRSVYCTACRPLVRLDRARIRAARFRLVGRAS